MIDSLVRHRKLNGILEHIVSRQVHIIDTMSKSSCEVFAQHFFSFSKIEDFNSVSIANCVFNSFLSYTAIMLNIVTIHAIRKTSSLSKTLKTLLLSLAVSDVGVGFLVQPTGQVDTTKQYYVQHVQRFLHSSIFVFYRVVLRCRSHKCRQVLSYSSSSQIPGTCDSQACCCCGDLNLAVKCIFIFNGVVATSVRYSLAIYIHWRWCLPSRYNSGLHQDLFNRETPQESDSGPARTESKFCQPY